MGRREHLAKVAENTLAIIKDGEYKNSKGKIVVIREEAKFAIQNTKVYSPRVSDELLKTIELTNNFNTKFEVTSETTLKAAARLVQEGYNVVALNFASAKNPGGGFLKGSSAQEESLARSSALYNCISPLDKMYNENRKKENGAFYTDYMSYAPQVPVFKNDDGDLLDETFSCSFITAPAVNAGVVRNFEKSRINDIKPTMLRRIEKILAIALENNHKVIILGAFGCGVFENRPADVAAMFRQVLRSGKFKGQFEKVVFAVYDNSSKKEVLNIFKNNFR